MLHLEKSAAAFAEAQTLMPGGVNSPVRSYNRIGCPPPFIAWAKGSTICDIDGNQQMISPFSKTREGRMWVRFS